MNNQDLNHIFSKLSTPLISDACMRLGLPLRIAPPAIRPLIEGSHIAGHVVPVQHYGSVDIFLEALRDTQPGDIFVIDNEGREYEGCIGDLTVLEVQAHDLGGIIVWGSHRDTTELLKISFPVFSYGAYPAGPRQLDPRQADALVTARFGDFIVGKEDVVFADDDGVAFTAASSTEYILKTALTIREKERQQAETIQSGETLHKQLRFDEYLNRRSSVPDYTFRKHLREIGGAIEE